MPERVTTHGKHLALGGDPFRVRGVTYGSFLPRIDGQPFPERPQLKKDLAAMAAVGLNTVRTYTLPPTELLDIAAEVGLRVLVGLHYHDWRDEPSPGRAGRRRIADAGRRAVEEAMARCGGRPEVLAVSVGNEVPSDVVRLYGIADVEDALSSLAAEVHAADPGMLATYGSYPSTEYLRVDEADLFSFNVFLEDPLDLRRYLRRLQVVAGDRPLLVGELGLAASVHGRTAQAASLRAQLLEADESGCAGATVFAWTDEWGIAGYPVEGWGFGVTDEERRPKPALDVISKWCRSSVRDLRRSWPGISVVVCAYNEQATIFECLASLARCDYPDLDVTVCDDGSTDATRDIAGRFGFRLLRLAHGGLAAARNAGVAAARNDIVAFLDADAACHPEWPYHLALSLEDGAVATGGPNLPVPDAGLVERAVAASPGAPVEVLVGDDRAEHVPGCNMAFRKEALSAVGGFDPVYTAAGDDVDVCWKILDAGGQIAFSPAAQVRHHRRASVRSYLRQQRGYGRAERLLRPRHARRFNRLRQARWTGVVYGGSRLLPSLLRPVVYHGSAGAAGFQPVRRRPAHEAAAWAPALLPLAAAPAVVGLALAPWNATLLWVPFVSVALAMLYAAVVAAATPPPRDERRPGAFRALVAFLHLAQPFVRTAGRLSGPPAAPRVLPESTWDGDRWTWMSDLERRLAHAGCAVRFGRTHDEWDLGVTVGPLMVCRVNAAVAWGWQPRYRSRLRPRTALWVLAGTLSGLGASGAAVSWALGAVAVAACAETFVLRRRVGAVLRASTADAP